MELSIDIGPELAQLTAGLQAAPEQLRRATNRALERTLSWLRVRLAREMAAAFDLPNQAVKIRVRGAVDRRAQAGTLWMGLDPIAARYLARLSLARHQTATGVQIRSHTFEQAFIASVRHGHVGVFKRLTSRRLPIDQVKAGLDPGAFDGVVTRYEERARQRFVELLDHEIDYLVSHGVKR